ncbi:hypothetical protein [Halomonas hibernica]|uniref:hypothetical protein n=1 Tax=Halomonas hibernica TaxID=2591147 RepID=UPI001554BD62|nr:hypothetical protein [Halomonas hibernica]
MKKLLLALPLSIVLLSTAQAQQIETEQDLLDNMLFQMAGQVTEGKADLSQNSFLSRESIIGSKTAETRLEARERLVKPVADNRRVSNRPLTRPILEQ